MRHANKVLLTLIVLVPVLYGIAYLAMLSRARTLAGMEWRPTYRWGGAVTEAFFAPAHAIDMRLRPERWRRRLADPYDTEVFEY